MILGPQIDPIDALGDALVATSKPTSEQPTERARRAVAGRIGRRLGPKEQANAERNARKLLVAIDEGEKARKGSGEP